jgi:predicted transcriptional regulator
MKNDLFETTMKQIRESGLSASQIARGANVGKRWMHDLVAGRFTDPGVKKIQKIHNYLSSLKQAA